MADKEATNSGMNENNQAPVTNESENLVMTVEQFEQTITQKVNERLAGTNLDEIISSQVTNQVNAKLAALKLNEIETSKSTKIQDKFYSMNYAIRKVEDHEKLSGWKMWKKWLNMIETDLQSLGLEAFLKEERPESIDVSDAVFRKINATALNVIKGSVSKVIATNITDQSAYKAFKQLESNYQPTETLQNFDLIKRFLKTKMLPGFEPNRFVADFERLIAEFAERQMPINEEFKKHLFFTKLTGIEDKNSPYSTMFGSISALPVNLVTWEFVKQKFLSINPPKADQKKKQPTKVDEISASSTSNTSKLKVLDLRSNDITINVYPNNESHTDDLQHEDIVHFNVTFDNNFIVSNMFLEPNPNTQRTNSSNGQPAGQKRKSSDDNAGPSQPTKRARNGVKPPVSPYTPEQQKKLSTMSDAEKKAIQCAKCGLYFHNADSCTRKGKVCYRCYKEGHIGKNCRHPYYMPKHKKEGNYDINENDFQREETSLVDSGANQHAYFDLEYFEDYKEFPSSRLVKLFANNYEQASGSGNVLVLMSYKGVNTVLRIRDVVYVPKADRMVLSANLFNTQFQTSIHLNIKTGTISFRRMNRILTRLTVENKMYFVHLKLRGHSSIKNPVSQITNTGEFNVINNDSVNNTKIIKRKKHLSKQTRTKLLNLGTVWHRTLGHINSNYVNRFAKCALNVPELICNDSIKSCMICAKAKIKRKNFDSDRDRASRVGEILHSDILGPVQPPTYRNQNRYVLLIIDDFSKYIYAYTMKNKTETLNNVRTCLIELRAKYTNPGQFHKFRCDKDTVFMSREFKELLSKFGMRRQEAETDVHEHNGTSERAIQTLEERTRSLLLESGFPVNQWGTVVQAAVYLYNRTPHSSVDLQAPYELFENKSVDAKYLKPLGSRCEVLIHNIPKGQKFTTRSKTEYLIGYTSTGYLTFDPKTKAVTDNCNVIVYPEFSYRLDFPNEVLPPDFTINVREVNTVLNPNPVAGTPVQVGGGDINMINYETDIENYKEINDDGPNTCFDYPTNTQVYSLDIIDSEYNWEVDSKEIIINAIKFTNPDTPNTKMPFALITKDFLFHTVIPITYEQATRGTEQNLWLPAIKYEIEALKSRNVFTPVKRTKDMKIVPTKYIFTIKDDGTHRARIVAIGCRDTEKYTLGETCSPTPYPLSIRFFFAYAAQNKMDIKAIDIDSAFLCSDIDREKYIQIPKGFDVDTKEYVGRLNKSLYGLTIAPMLWSKTILKFLKTIGFLGTPREPCLLVKTINDSKIFLLIYVDDILIAAKNSKNIDDTIALIENTYKIKKLGYPKRFLGYEITKCDDGIFLHQTKYIEEKLTLYKLQDCNTAETPMLPLANHNISQKDHPKQYDYKAVIGALLYLSNATRPDVAFAVSYLARYQASPEPIHFKLMTRIFRYLKNTLKYGLKYVTKPNTKLKIDAYADADFSLSEIKRRSTTGYIIRVMDVPFAWKSSLQNKTAGSTTEAELHAVNTAIKDVLYIMRLCEEIFEPLTLPITIYEDNTSTIRNCTPHVSKNRLRYLEREQFEAAENVERGYVSIQSVKSDEQLADLLTKPLQDTKFKQFRDKLVTRID